MSELECEHGRLRRQCNECDLEHENQQLQVTNKQLLEALKRAFKKIDGRHDNICAVLSAKSVLHEAITNAKQVMGDSDE